MMGRQRVDQSQLFYLFNLEEQIPADHLLRRLNPIVTRVLVGLREKLAPFYSDIGRPSIDPELMIRMLIVGYCYGIRFERRLCEEVELHLAYRWFCRLDLDDKVPDHSTFSVNRHGRFRDSNILRHVFEAVVRACMNAGLVKGEGFAVDASVTEANASRYHGKAPDEIDWLVPERQTHAVVEFLAAFDDEDSDADRKVPKVVSPVDPSSAWTAKANKRVQFGYGLNYLIDLGPHAVIPPRPRGHFGNQVTSGPVTCRHVLAGNRRRENLSNRLCEGLLDALAAAGFLCGMGRRGPRLPGGCFNSGDLPAAVATSRGGHRKPKDQARKKVQPPRLKKVASPHCGLTMSQGNSRTNGISDRESNSQPNCEDHQDIGHTYPTAS
jgi:transposase